MTDNDTRGHIREIYLAGGCFWGVEKYFAQVDGVLETDVGYANGHTESPAYRDVCRGNTGFAEAVRVAYDSRKANLAFLLELYFDVIDPTSVDRQGNDVGPQYRTGIYYTDADDRPAIDDSIARLEKELGRKTAIEVEPLKNYCPAEEYHQKYLDKNPGGYCHIGPDRFEKARRAKDPGIERALRSRLTELQYQVTQCGATERPFENEYCDHFEPGVYVDIVSGEQLFSSVDKFHSGCGWPSFTQPIRQDALIELEDLSHGMRRVEVRGRVSGAHLGHVFEDGPPALGGRRYCINSAALRFVPEHEMHA